MFKKWIENLVDVKPADAGNSLDLRQASVQLMLEVARCDTSITDVERHAIIKTLELRSGLSESALNEMMDSSEESVDKSISFHQHIKLVNEQFDREKKIELITQMWEVAYADGQLDKHEEAFIRQVSDLIYIKHRDFMQAKHRVLEKL